MTQTAQGMGFGKERRELEEEKLRRPDRGGLHVEGPECRSCVHGNFYLGRGQDERNKNWRSGTYQYG